jgi:hypothetical protein
MKKIEIFNFLKCKCGEELDDNALDNFDRLEGYCQDCYEASMDAAYSDLPDVFKDFKIEDC